MNDVQRSISRLLMRGASEAARKPGRSGQEPARLVRVVPVQVRRESRDAKGRRIVERWTETVRG
jgi:hypothetical protein